MSRSFAQLQTTSLPRVELEGINTRAIIEELASKKGISITLGPHETNQDVDIEWYVVVSKLSTIGEYNLMRLKSAKQLRNTIYVRGSYMPDKNERYLGKIEAEVIEIR